MELKFKCPFCHRRGLSPDRKRHLYVNPTTNKAHCFRCGYGTNHAHSVAEREGLDVESSLWEACTTESTKNYDTCTLPPEYSNDWSTTHGNNALQYLQSRGLSLPLISGYQLGYCSTGSYANRIITPVYEKGVLVFFQARDWTDLQTPKYLGPAGKGRDALFNLDRPAKKGVLLLVEGTFDALQIPKYGVALLGKSLSNAKINKIIAAKPKAVIILLDTDAAVNASKIREKIEGSIPIVSCLRLGRSKDLGDATREEVEATTAICNKIAFS